MSLDKMLFTDTPIPLLSKALDAYALRHKVIANNIANITTPGYQRGEVEFEGELRKALDGSSIKGRTSDPRHIPIGAKDLDDVQPRIKVPDDPTMSSGLNNVSVEQEMAEAAKNQLRYLLAAQRISGIFQSLKLTITGRAG